MQRVLEFRETRESGAACKAPMRCACLLTAATGIRSTIGSDNMHQSVAKNRQSQRCGSSGSIRCPSTGAWSQKFSTKVQHKSSLQKFGTEVLHAGQSQACWQRSAHISGNADKRSQKSIKVLLRSSPLRRFWVRI